MRNRIILADLEEIYQQKMEWSVLAGKTILVTGAYGMLATYVVLFLLYLKKYQSVNVKIILLVRSRDKCLLKFAKYTQITDFDIVESNLLSEVNIEQKIDYIIHAASLASPQFYSVCPVDVLEPNVIGTYNLLKLAVKKNVKGFLLFSTGDVYGSVQGVKDITESTFGIMDTLDIHNCYSESKRMAETICNSFFVQYNVPVKIARIWHTYAPTMDIDNDPRVFASFVGNVVRGQDIVMKSNGTGKRCFCYISDAVAGYFKILLEGASGEAYNVCNETQLMSIKELAESLVSLRPEAGLKVVRQKRNRNECYTENVLLIDSEGIPSSKKLRTLGWCSNVTVKEGFLRVINYYNHQER